MLVGSGLKEGINSIFSTVSMLSSLQRIQQYLARPHRRLASSYMSSTVCEDLSGDGSSTSAGAVGLEAHPILSEYHRTISTGPVLRFRSFYARWDCNKPWTLANVSFDIVAGSINLVVGPTGSGKSTLLRSLIGEVNYAAGSAVLSNSNITVGFVEQVPWISNASIRENIIGDMRWLDQGRYWDVIKTCALERDLAQLEFGDETICGDNGSVLSGGQRVRVVSTSVLRS